MRKVIYPVLFIFAVTLTACSGGQGGQSSNNDRVGVRDTKPAGVAPRNSASVVHVFVALCDNVNQGIVPVSASLGDGDNPKTNLYWGAAFGIKTFFNRSKDWKQVAEVKNPQPAILERVVLKHKTKDLFIVADAYRGKEIKQTTVDFLEAAAGMPGEELSIKINNTPINLHLSGSADVVAYIGHNGLMDFALNETPKRRDDRERQAIILACASKPYFSSALKSTGASPLLWTTNLMAPEAYVLSAALDGWMAKENDEQVRARAANAYHQYQNCGIRGAMNLFATGW